MIYALSANCQNDYTSEQLFTVDIGKNCLSGTEVTSLRHHMYLSYTHICKMEIYDKFIMVHNL